MGSTFNNLCRHEPEKVLACLLLITLLSSSSDVNESLERWLTHDNHLKPRFSLVLNWNGSEMIKKGSKRKLFSNCIIARHEHRWWKKWEYEMGKQNLTFFRIATEKYLFLYFHSVWPRLTKTHDSWSTNSSTLNYFLLLKINYASSLFLCLRYLFPVVFAKIPNQISSVPANVKGFRTSRKRSMRKICKLRALAEGELILIPPIIIVVMQKTAKREADKQQFSIILIPRMDSRKHQITLISISDFSRRSER